MPRDWRLLDLGEAGQIALRTRLPAPECNQYRQLSNAESERLQACLAQAGKPPCCEIHLRNNLSGSSAQLIKRLYDRFNARDIDGVLAGLATEVAWVNGMDGGHVHGREAVRDYWTRQWAVVSPHVEPVAFQTTDDGVIAVEVIQTVFDLDGQPLVAQTHGLKDKTVTHFFRVEGGKITRFDIEDTQ